MVSLQAVLTAVVISGAGQTVLLDFYSDSCGPCRTMDPTIRELAGMGYPVRKVNVEQDRALAAKYRVQGIPCFVMLVDGREVDRVVGATSFGRLQRMCKSALRRRSPLRRSPVLPVAMTTKTGPTTSPEIRPPVPIPSLDSGRPLWDVTPPAADARPRAQATAEPVSGDRQQAAPAWTPRGGGPEAKSDAKLIAASVRLRVEDPQGHSCGSGTIIDAQKGEALILTCGHIFRDSKGKGRIDVDLFGPGAVKGIPARLISYDLDRDVGLLCIRTPGPVATARVAPPGYQLGKGSPVVSVGCNNADQPSVRHSRVAALNKYLGPPNLEVAGLPVEGRSGGGLFSEEGQVIGVCNAADPSDREGLYAALPSIHAVLDQAKLAFVYNPPEDVAPESGPAESAPPTALVDLDPPPMPERMPRPSRVVPETKPLETSLPSVPAAQWSPRDNVSRLSVEEQAALDEICKRLEEGAEVICVVRSRRDPQAKSEIIMLDKASPLFLRRLAAEARGQDSLQSTSLEVPRPAPTAIPREPAPAAPRQAPGVWTGGGSDWRPRGVDPVTRR